MYFVDFLNIILWSRSYLENVRIAVAAASPSLGKTTYLHAIELANEFDQVTLANFGKMWYKNLLTQRVYQRKPVVESVIWYRKRPSKKCDACPSIVKDRRISFHNRHIHTEKAKYGERFLLEEDNSEEFLCNLAEPCCVDCGYIFYYCNCGGYSDDYYEEYECNMSHHYAYSECSNDYWSYF